MQSQTKNCQNCKTDFVIEPDDFSFYEKMKVPPPTFCPACRTQRRIAFRNERGLYKRKCDFSGKEIFSVFSADSPVKVYEKDIWLSDTWDPMEYGVEIDWNKPFLKQLHELMLRVPFKSRNVVNGTNSDYSNNATDPKNCYLVFNATYPEDSMYSNGVNFSRDCVDVSHVSKSETCHQSFWLGNCSRVFYSSQCVESSDLWFCRDCQGCMDCFGSVNLRNKNHHFFNVEMSKEEYDKKLKEYMLNTKEGVERARSEAHAFWKKFPNKNHQGIKNINSTGSYVTNSKNVKDSFLVREGENLRYCQYLQEAPAPKDCYDYSGWGSGAEMVYEAISTGSNVQNAKFTMLTQENVHDMEYTIACGNGSHDLFGCVGLRKKEYCILNKQYKKEEYEELVAKIKKHMDDMPYTDQQGRVYKYGEFYPVEFSPFAYNETIAQEYFPLTKGEIEKKGYRWREPDTKSYVATISSDKIPGNILETSDSVLGEILECAHKGECNQGCTKAFRVIHNELQFYRKVGAPLPTLCPACRTMERLKMRLNMTLYDGECMCGGKNSVDGQYENFSIHPHGSEKCENKFKTGFNPQKGDMVYCEQCYQQEVD